MAKADKDLDFVSIDDSYLDDFNDFTKSSVTTQPQDNTAKDNKRAGAVSDSKDTDATIKDHVFDARAFLKTVPNQPGCYRMYDSKGQVIYVGKARDLKSVCLHTF